MNLEAECAECRRLLEAASAAITQQLRALTRLNLAQMRNDTDLVPKLETDVREMKLSREKAVAAYKDHRRSHALGASGAAVG